ncbi:protein kinase domain-containing protein [Singulisphaera sp. PoT]|uniref:protein kinase domain-containing protein n=1 Tax=Singulisphaera sp. PoT TaxID=3411797 RepID=UPI003BF60DA6
MIDTKSDPDSGSDSDSEFDPVDLLIDAFLDRYRRGERPSIQSLAQEHPEHADRLRSLIPAMLAMEKLGDPSDPRSGAGHPGLVGKMPERLGDYLLIRPLGFGGMGTVYEAIQESLGRHVALKTIPSPHPDDANRLERFRREALAAARLQHPHIVPVFGLGEHEGRHFYTMQFIEGRSLDFVLREAGRLKSDPQGDPDIHDFGVEDPRTLSTHLALGLRRGNYLPQGAAASGFSRSSTTALASGGATRSGSTREAGSHYLRSAAWLGAQVAEALDYAHKQGVLHRDIKPSNLLLDANGHVWVADFGLAKTQDCDDLTRTGDIVGTLRYMAPERFNGWSDPRSDVFALGATLYELFAFRPAFDETDRIKLVDRLLHGGPTPLRQLDHRFPRDLETIVLKALSNSSSERYTTAGHLADDLRRFVEGRPIEARRSNLFERAWRWGRRSPIEAGAAVTVVATLSLAVAVSMNHANEKAKAADEVGKLAKQLAKERGDLRVSLAESQRLLAMRDFERGQTAFEKEQVGVGLLWMMETWRSATAAGDLAWRDVALANVSAWGDHLPRLKGLLSHEGSINAARFSPDGRTIVTGGDDGKAILWEAGTAEPIDRPIAHPGIVSCVAFSPDGKRLLTGGSDGNARLWEAGTLRALGPVLPHGADISALAFSPDGNVIVTGGADGKARLWDARDGRPVGISHQSRGKVMAIAFQPGRDIVAVGIGNGSVDLLDAHDGRLIGSPVKNSNMILALAFSPDGKTLFTSSWGGWVQAWDMTTHRPTAVDLKALRGNIRAIAFSPDGRMYLTGGEDKSARLWDSRTNEPLGPPLYHLGPISTVAFRGDGKAFLTAGSDRTVRVWEAESCLYARPLMTIQGGGQSLAFSPDGHSFLGARRSGDAQVWSLETGTPEGGILPGRGLVTSVACGPDGKALLVGGSPARLWNPSSEATSVRFLWHPSGASVVAFSPNGEVVATGGADRTVRFWDARDAEPLGEPIEHSGSVDSLAFSPDGKAVVSGLDGGSAQVWSLATRRPVGPAMPHPGAVSALAFSPDGKTVVSGCEDGMVRIWDPSSGTQVVPPLPHQAWVFAVAFSPDGKSVLSGSRDKTVRIWHAATGQPIGPPFPHPAQLWNVAFAPDGKSILTGDTHSVARVYEVPRTPLDAPDLMMSRLEVLTGLRLDASQGAISTLDNASWRATRRRLARPSSEHGPGKVRPGPQASSR